MRKMHSPDRMCAQLAATYLRLTGASLKQATHMAIEIYTEGRSRRSRRPNFESVLKLLRQRRRQPRVVMSDEQAAALRRLFDGDDAAAWDALRAFEAPDGTWK
jgi:hypothetical protein